MVYTLGSNCTKHPLASWRLPLAAAASLALGALKEIGDGLHWWPGAVDLADLVIQMHWVATLTPPCPLSMLFSHVVPLMYTTVEQRPLVIPMLMFGLNACTFFSRMVPLMSAGG